jgi:uncharacterized protein YodC (DUF2158 family)
MMVLASAALAGSLLATDAQAHGGGVGHMGGAHIGSRAGGFGGARVGGIGGGIGGGYIAGIPQGAVGYAAGTGYGTGILYGRYSVLAASALAQTATPHDSTSASAPTPAQGAAQNPRIGTVSGPGISIVSRDGVPAKAASTATQNQSSPALSAGRLVRLRSGGPLMTIREIKGDQVDCFWTDYNGQINADSFPLDVLQML